MINSLKNHPFSVEAFFNYSLVLSYALPKEKLSNLLPECLEPDTLHDRWAFLAVAMVDTKRLRPAGFPAFLGSDFFLTGYRVFVRYRSPSGKRLRGLYILGSQTNRRNMTLFGNLFSHYRYTTIDISRNVEGNVFRLHSEKAGLHVGVESGHEHVPLPSGSPFADWKEARRFAGPLPFTFSYHPDRREVLIIEGVREHWTPEPVIVTQHKVGFLSELGLQNDAVLANAFIVRHIPYLWKKGRTELWTP